MASAFDFCFQIDIEKVPVTIPKSSQWGVFCYECAFATLSQILIRQDSLFCLIKPDPTEANQRYLQYFP
jgi:hypothetical protein